MNCFLGIFLKVTRFFNRRSTDSFNNRKRVKETLTTNPSFSRYPY